MNADRSRGGPQGLHVSLLTSERIEDLTTTDFAVVPQGTDIPAAASIAVHSDSVVISGVTRHEDVTLGAAGATPAGRPVRYVVVSQQATPLAAMAALWEAEAELILVSRDPDARRAAGVVGVVTPATLVRVLKTDEELS